MNDNSTPPSKSAAPKPQLSREEQKKLRLKKALRENLQRRKQHARAQKEKD